MKLAKICEEVLTFDWIGLYVIVKQHLITHVTKVAIEDFKRKQTFTQLLRKLSFYYWGNSASLSDQGPD